MSESGISLIGIAGIIKCEEDGEEVLAAGDVALIDSGEKFYWEGEMEIFRVCTLA